MLYTSTLFTTHIQHGCRKITKQKCTDTINRKIAISHSCAGFPIPTGCKL